jgi:hypothetical protein
LQAPQAFLLTAGQSPPVVAMVGYVLARTVSPNDEKCPRVLYLSPITSGYPDSAGDTNAWNELANVLQTNLQICYPGTIVQLIKSDKTSEQISKLQSGGIQILRQLHGSLEHGLWVKRPRYPDTFELHGSAFALNLPIVCFTEWSLGESLPRTTEYGRIGLGFPKRWVIERGGQGQFSPCGIEVFSLRQCHGTLSDQTS